jgi:drug efflux transport system ATP-binding protein
MHPIEVNSVIKKFDSTTAVNNISFSVNKGEIFGLIGPDGAGKTTLIRMIVSLLNPDSGMILFNGKNVSEHSDYVRSHIGYMPQKFSLYQDLSVEENMHFFSDLFGVDMKTRAKRMEEMYAFSRLGPFKDRRAGNLSGGMKQKLALSCMLMHGPEVMILDEPTFGVDPISRKEFWDILYILRDGGATLVVSTPYMDEAQRCDRIGLVYNGHILQSDTPEQVLKKFPYEVFRAASAEPHNLFNALKKDFAEEDIQLFPDGVYIIDREKIGLHNLEKKVNELLDKDAPIEQAQVGLENVFLSMMQEKMENNPEQ